MWAVCPYCNIRINMKKLNIWNYMFLIHHTSWCTSKWTSTYLTNNMTDVCISLSLFLFLCSSFTCTVCDNVYSVTFFYSLFRLIHFLAWLVLLITANTFVFSLKATIFSTHTRAPTPFIVNFLVGLKAVFIVTCYIGKVLLFYRLWFSICHWGVCWIILDLMGLIAVPNLIKMERE